MSDREEFEEAASRLGYSLKMADTFSGEYMTVETDTAWHLWQEARAQGESELTAARDEAERLRGRMSELGTRCAYLDELVIKLQAINKANELRKQAEAVEEAAVDIQEKAKTIPDSICTERERVMVGGIIGSLRERARSLRNQAEAIEKGERDE